MAEELRPTPFSTKPRPDGEALPLSVRNDRAATAYQLRLTGMSWPKVAEAVGWGNVPHPADYCQTQVKIYLDTCSVHVDREERQHILQTECDRLDRLQEIAWEMAEAGGDGALKAIDTVLRVMNTRAKLLGLETVQVQTTTQSMVVVGGDKENFLRAAHQVIKGDVTRQDEAS